METTDTGGRLEDLRLITGQGCYVADLALPNTVHMAVVRSPYAHARITGTDGAAAAAAPGVLAVYFAQDLAADGIPDLPCGVQLLRPNGEQAHQARRPVLARDRVRYVGEAIAVVIAETVAAARDAAELVAIDYEELPTVASAQAARMDGAPRVWDEVDGNVAFVWRRGDMAAAEAALAKAAHITRLSSQITRVNTNSLETRGCIGQVAADGRLTIHVSNQSPHQLRGVLAAMFGRKAEEIRVLVGDVGGSFGMKSGAYSEDVIVLWAARQLGRPVRWIADRSEGFLNDDHARDVRFDAELGLDKDGRFVALKVHYDINIGAYLSGRSSGLIGNSGGITGVYRMPVTAAEIFGVHTNTQTTAPYRGAGRPEATYTIERLIDIAAAELGLDPFEIRMRNLVPKDAMPYDTGFTFTYDCGEFEGNMIAAARKADLAGFAARRAASAKIGMLRGIGISNPIEAAGGPFVKPAGDMASITFEDDGMITVATGSMSTGQGHETMLCRLVAERFNLPLAKLRFRSGDTDLLPNGRGNGGSSATPVGATAMVRTATKVIETGRRIAAEILEADESEIDFDAGTYRVKGTNRNATLEDVARHTREAGRGKLSETGAFQPPAVTFPNGCHLCEVEVDPETGASRIVRYTVVEDLGTVLNPVLVEGQMHGGIAQGAGQALGEVLVHDPDSAQLMSASFMDYMMPRADDLPSFDIATRSVPTKVNDIGAKGVGEAGTVGSLVAVINAVCHALQPLGVKHIEMPATPARVWAAIQITKAR